MKRFFTRMGYVCVLLSMLSTAYAQTIETFNSRSNLHGSQVKFSLQQSCWQFKGFEVDTIALEGDGSIVSTGNSTSGFYTPVLNIAGDLSIRFKYSLPASAPGRKLFRIYLADGNNDIVDTIDSMDVSTANPKTLYVYNKTVNPVYGSYKLYVKYEGGAQAPVVIDELKVSANLRYPGGCNVAPTATDDIVTGNANRTASGVITTNDTDVNGEALSSYLITTSEDGTISLEENGHFSFTPKAGFAGKQTSFTYQVCDFGQTRLCSELAKVTILFPTAAINPLSVTDVQAITKVKAVDVRWTASADAAVERFEVERSIDGEHFETVGSVVRSAIQNHQYLFTDQLRERMMKNNDLYYRVKQVTRSGESVATKPVIVRVFQTKTLQSVSVSANPAANDIKVNFQLNENAFIIIKLTAASGEEVMRRTVKSMRGTDSYALEGTGNIRKGLYVLEMIVNSNERMVVKIIKS